MGTRDALIVPGVSLLVDHLSRRSWDMCAHGYVYTHLYLFLYLSAYTYQKQLAHTDTSSLEHTLFITTQSLSCASALAKKKDAS